VHNGHHKDFLNPNKEDIMALGGMPGIGNLNNVVNNIYAMEASDSAYAIVEALAQKHPGTARKIVGAVNTGLKYFPPTALLYRGYWGCKLVRCLWASNVGSRKEAFNQAEIQPVPVKSGAMVFNAETYKAALIKRVFGFKKDADLEERKQLAAKLFTFMGVQNVEELDLELKILVKQFIDDGGTNLEQAGRALFRKSGMKPALMPCTPEGFVDFLMNVTKVIAAAERVLAAADTAPASEGGGAEGAIDAPPADTTNVPAAESDVSPAAVNTIAEAPAAARSAPPEIENDPREPEARGDALPVRAASAPPASTNEPVSVDPEPVTEGALSKEEAAAAAVLVAATTEEEESV
jgi:hypothetical protein